MKIKNPLKGKIIKPKGPVEPKEATVRKPVDYKSKVNFSKPIKPVEPVFREPIEGKIDNSTVVECKPSKPFKFKTPISAKQGKRVEAVSVKEAEYKTPVIAQNISVKAPKIIENVITSDSTSYKEVKAANTISPVEANLNISNVIKAASDENSIKRAVVTEAEEITDIDDIEVTDVSDAEEVLYEILSSKLENAKSVPDTLTLDELFAPYVK